MKKIVLLLIILLPLMSCNDGLYDLYDDLTMKVPLCVDSTVSSSGDGRGWANAFKTIQEAVDAAEDGEEIWVTGDTYYHSETININCDNLSIYGGFNGMESRKSERDHVKKTVTRYMSNTSYGIIINAKNVTIDGFEISSSDCEGGAVTIITGSIVDFVNCYFYNNRVTTGDGGAVNMDRAVVNIANSVFEKNNSVFGYGGAVYALNSNLTIENSFFGGDNPGSGNSAPSGGAITYTGSDAELIIKNSHFNRNSATSWGGALYIADGASGSLRVTIENSLFGNIAANTSAYGGAIRISDTGAAILRCGFSNNQAVSDGGAIDAGITGSLNISSCYFSENSATGSNGHGGAINIHSGNITISNSIFYNNYSESHGGAIYNGSYNSAQSDPAISIINSTFFNNTANPAESTVSGGAIFFMGNHFLYNCVFYGNNAGSTSGEHEDFVELFSHSINRYNCFYDFTKSSALGAVSSCYNSSEMPFESIDNSNAAFLHPGSFLVNKGLNTIQDFTMPSIDMAGNPRIVNNIIDLGAYEKQ